MTLPLEGVLVVAVEQAVAAPLATRKMADAGARVIKVERLDGDFARGYDHVVGGESAYFVWLNRGKESVALDLKDPEGAALLARMVGGADVFVQNLAPGAAARAGFGSDALRGRDPRLITCDVTGYGGEGPYARMKAYDALVQGEVGLEAVTGTEAEPARVGISVCDIAAGMHVYTAVLEALLLRERTGEGASLEVSLFGSVADWMAVPYLHQVHGGRAPARAGLRHPGIAPYGPFRSGEGDVVLVAVQNEREWHRLCEDVLAAPELAREPRFGSNPDRVRHRDALEALLQRHFGAMTTEVMAARLTGGGIAWGRVRSVADFAAHPQLSLTSVDTEGGTVRVPADPVVWRTDRSTPSRAGETAGADTGRPARPHLARRVPRVPALDEHGAAIRAEFAG